VAGATVRWNGSDRPTAFNDSTQLIARLAASDIATAGTAAVTVSNPSPGGGTSNASTFAITAGGVSPQSIAVAPSGQFAYVAEGCGDGIFGYVSMYTIDATTGALASIGPPIITNDEGARSVAVSPDGRFAYAANWGEGDTQGSISAYTINLTTGALTFTASAWAPCEAPPSPGSCAPWSMTVHPSGKFAYVANEGGFAPTSVSTYAVDPATGTLRLIGLVAVGSRAIYLAMHPSGKFAYVAESNGNVSTYVINTTTGVLTSVGTVATGSTPPSIAIHPSGKFAYVAVIGNGISTYSIDPTTGTLAPVGTVALGSGSIAIHPSGKFAYVANADSSVVSTYTIDTATGALTSKGTIPAGSGPTSIVIHPSGEFAYVANSGSNDVWTYRVDAVTGTLTLIATIGT